MSDYKPLIPQVFEEIGKLSSSGRCGNPEEVAQIVCFLASDAAPYINGENIHISGTDAITTSLATAFDKPE